MPRKHRTQSGADAQKIESVEGQRYGEGIDQQEMQRLLPAPQNRQTTASPVAAPTAPPGQVPAGAPPVDLGALLGQAPIGLLSGTQRPDQPVTAGLDSGPGGGSELLGGMRPTSPMSRTLRLLSQRTGDPIFRDMADRAGL